MRRHAFPPARPALQTAAALLATALAVAVPAAAARQAPRPTLAAGERSVTAPPIPPVRRAPATRPAAPPALPSGALALRPSTLTLVLTRDQAGREPATLRQTVTRTADRVHISGGAGGPDWLFERNPIDPRRVSGHFVDHATKTIVFHSDSDLDLMLGIPGWTHVLMLGCDAPSTPPRGTTADTRVIDGLPFVRTTGGGAPGPTWWNAELLLPAECTRGVVPGATRMTLEAVRGEVNPDLLRLPSARFPGYRTLDLADWLEGH